MSRDSEAHAHIGGVAKQMVFIWGTFRLILLTMTDNLSSGLQGSSVSAIDGQNLVKVVKTL